MPVLCVTKNLVNAGANKNIGVGWEYVPASLEMLVPDANINAGNTNNGFVQ